MPETKAPPQIFDHKLLSVRRIRASRRGVSFLAERCAMDAADRLCDMNRQFETALIIGPPKFTEILRAHLPPDKMPKSITVMDTAPNLEVGPYDLIISALRLHTVNDLPGALIELRSILEPDGLFLASFFGGETLKELRQAAYAADDAVLGGISPRVAPFADYSQAAALLQRAGFALPVIDTDRCIVHYSDIQRLFEDLRDLGESNALVGRSHKRLTKDYRRKLFGEYLKHFSADNKARATFEILWMTGWAPHESQQKPLKPGSAKMRLADALGVKETKTPQ